jgi:hypothetical protein
MTRSLFRATVLCLAVTGLAACGGSTPETPVPHEEHPAGDAASLPPGHPPAGSTGNMGALPPVPAGAGTGSAALTWEAPGDWVSVQPSSNMRRAQYQVPGAAGDAECVVFYFGPGQGGDAMSNAYRWADMFTQPDGGSSRDVLKTEPITVGDMAVLLIEVTGIYGGGGRPMGGGGQAAPGQMLLGSVAEGVDANWFFKLTGPQETVEAQRAAFRSMMESLNPGSGSD